jgi:hypothetical protein
VFEPKKENKRTPRKILPKQLKKRNRKLLQKIQENIAKIEIKLEMN